MDGWRVGGVLPIKADGDGFAQEVRLHLFYCTSQSEVEAFSDDGQGYSDQVKY